MESSRGHLSGIKKTKKGTGFSATCTRKVRPPKTMGFRFFHEIGLVYFGDNHPNISQLTNSYFVRGVGQPPTSLYFSLVLLWFMRPKKSERGTG